MEAVSEFELIRRLTDHLGTASDRVTVGPGDDAAVIAGEGLSDASVVSVDAVVEDVHFRRSAGMSSIGHKAFAQALSDLAAMGADSSEAYVALGIPDDVSAADCVEMYTAIDRLALATGTTVAGGDVVRSPVLWLSITVVGRLPDAGSAVLRSGARAGDVVVVSGALGGAAAALAAEKRGLPAADVLTRRLQMPEPRLAEGRALRESGATAMIDLSDGLGGDSVHVARASGVRIRIDLERLPLDEGVEAAADAAGRDVHELVAGGGEDYELLACMPPDLLESAIAAVERCGGTLSPVGAVEAGAGVRIVRPDGSLLEPAGFDQLALQTSAPREQPGAR